MTKANIKRYICIHGHFYQPPRENPWLSAIERQDSAFPYHDWNERITVESYAPNLEAKILGPNKKVVERINNYSKISFDFGPTLLYWLERHAPNVYKGIIDSDRISKRLFSGHGSAMAQCYNHMIMPLANLNDKITQVLWGLKDFKYRFGREPEGMWLPEAGVDLETLDILAQNNIRFTVLSPYQAKRAREIGKNTWKDVSHGNVDFRKPYICKLPSRRSIVIFFYDGVTSRDIAFGDLLNSGENFGDRLMGAFNENGQSHQLVSVATDGETFGHHHQFGEMALAYCFHYIQKNDLAQFTIFPEYLEKYPPTDEVEILEDTSWSCSHGVGRWKEDCGCSIGAKKDWNQEWRQYLREAMDWLRDELIKIYEDETRRLLIDPWKARNDYIDVILDVSERSRNNFFNKHAKAKLSEQERSKIIKLLEMQKNAMFMFTSCGWFFDDISGIETIQILQYAARAIKLAKVTSGANLERPYLDLLKRAQSNVLLIKDGVKLYTRFVKSAKFGPINE